MYKKTFFEPRYHHVLLIQFDSQELAVRTVDLKLLPSILLTTGVDSFLLTYVRSTVSHLLDIPIGLSALC